MSSEIRLYVLENLPTDLIEMDSWEKLEQVLIDLYFIEAKCAEGMTYALIADYNAALDALPEAQKEKEKELRHQQRVKEYTNDLITYAKGEIKHLEIIPSVESWSDEKIRKYAERIINNPARIDRIRAFSQFVNSESHGLVRFASHSGFVVQQAYNSSMSGTVARIAVGIINSKMNCVFLLRHLRRPTYNPHPAVIRILQGHTLWVTSVGVTPDGMMAVSASEDNTLRVWDLESGKCIRILKGHAYEVLSVCVTPDGKRAVSGSSDYTLRVWDLESGKCLKILEGHTNSVLSVCVTPDGGRAVSAGKDATLRVWDVESGKCMKVLDLEAYINSVRITPDGMMAFSSSYDNKLRVWDLESGKCMKILGGHAENVDSVDLTPDGKRAVSASFDDTLRVWDLENGKCLRTFKVKWRWSVSITHDGMMAVSGGNDTIIQIWDIESGKCLRSLKGNAPTNSVGITPDGRRAVSGGMSETTLQVWNIENGISLSALENLEEDATNIDFTPDGKRVVSASASFDQNLLRLWHLESGKCLKTIVGPPDGDNNRISNVRVTPDGRKAVSASNFSHGPQVWDIESGKWQTNLNEDSILSVSVSPDGRRVVSGGWYGELRVWDLESRKHLKTIEGHHKRVNSLSITHDGMVAVSGSDDNTVRVWDIESGKCLKIFEGHTDFVNSISVTPDGRKVVSGSRDRTLRFWDLVSSQCLNILKGHTGWVKTVSITADGKKTISGSGDQTLRVWDLESGACLAVYQGRCTIDSAIIRMNEHLVFSLSTGEIIFMTPDNLDIDAPVVTPIRIWLYSKDIENGKWDAEIRANCKWCGKRFLVKGRILKVINAITRNVGLSPNQSPCLELPAEAWDEPQLLSDCPSCHKPLRFNPFIVDNRERY